MKIIFLPSSSKGREKKEEERKIGGRILSERIIKRSRKSGQGQCAVRRGSQQ